MLIRACMARLCHVRPLQPSTTSRINLCAVENNLRRYSASVAQYRIHNEDEEDSNPGVNDSNAANTRRNLEARKEARETILVASDSEDGSFASAEEIDDDEIWADAFEYQDQMLSNGRLSQATQNEKENEAPTSRTGLAADKKYGGQRLSSDAAQAAHIIPSRASDYYARKSQQYQDIPLPRKHVPLCKEDYFTLKNNPTKFGTPPVVIYVTNENQLNSVIKLLRGPILSLDMEWIAWTAKKNISLIQLSDAHTVLLIQISQFRSFPYRLKQLIEDPSIIKCGVAIMGADASRLRDVYGVWAKGICELSYFARLVDREIHGPKNTLIKLSSLAKHYLGSDLAKGDVRCSDWSQIPLSLEQRQYAAIDAYAGYLIFAELERRRQCDPELRDIWPPVSACPPYQGKNTTVSKAVRSRPEKLPREKMSDSLADVRAALERFKRPELSSSMSSDTGYNEQADFEAATFTAAISKPARRPRWLGTTKSPNNKSSRRF